MSAEHSAFTVVTHLCLCSSLLFSASTLAMSASACSFLVNPSNNDLVDCVFGYLPSKGPAGLFLALFFLAAQANLYLAVSRRSFVYGWIAQCCLAEMAGYIARLVVLNNFTSNGYIAMTVLLLITPSLLAIANYHLLAKLLTLSEAASSDVKPTVTGNFVERLRNHFSMRRHLTNLAQPRMPDGRIRPEFASSLFTVLALITAILQGVGIGNLSSSDASQSDITSGNHLIIAGLSIALFTYVCFFCIAFYTYFSPHYNFHVDQSPAMRRLFIGIVSTQAVLGLRTLYRLIQYSLGTSQSNAISSREWCFYVFDATLVFICVAMFAIFDQQRNIDNAQHELDIRSRKSPPV